ncbi:aromatic amino acid aminotransferase [Lachnoclostridium sp. An169]|uniref:aminotransferase class I/II-fold pyridoxal phosphate-dependent enzyme n=1 Tax=Lachnoclostridium sp. An169 TaxID=1965569 RepID=UPI000B37EFAD|nr:aminotransferase class I/II-fold pyridoxal phosphate-dependent enzyme [Lachnoclostridium sp. An169]OUP85076.1 aromatic amino acid aminotransferase [Lachnoclostridium sp. An169]HJA64902.1 aminotransferase class I/II-fold pyridoxal phosphate-dependent enzyme [Candidatus Mediterraneibacter cottocaccae]
MRNPLSQKIIDIQPSGIRKFFDIVNEMDDAISLGVGEPDFDTPWRIREEGIFSLERGRTYYTSNAGLQELRNEICKYLERTIHVTYNPKTETLVTVGGSEAIDIGLRCMLDPGDEVLIPQPSYVSYLPCTVMADGVPVVVPLQDRNEFKLTVEDLEKYTTPKTKVLIMPFPNNPTGAIMTKEDLEPVAEFVKEHDLYVISDEIYSELSYKGKHVSIASLPGMRERTIVINGFSKGFAMTGWRLGYCCGPHCIIEQMTKLHQFAIMCAPTNSQYAAVEGLRNCEDEVEKMRKAYDQRRRFLMHEFKKIGLECFEPFGAFYVFPSIKEFGMTSEEFATKLLEEEKVAVVPGTAFGDCGEGFIRISYAYSLEDLKEAFGRVERFIQRLREEKNGGADATDGGESHA